MHAVPTLVALAHVVPAHVALAHAAPVPVALVPVALAHAAGRSTRHAAAMAPGARAASTSSGQVDVVASEARAVLAARLPAATSKNQCERVDAMQQSALRAGAAVWPASGDLCSAGRPVSGNLRADGGTAERDRADSHGL